MHLVRGPLHRSATIDFDTGVAAAARFGSAVCHVIGPLIAVEVAEVVLPQGVREPARIGVQLGGLIGGRHETVVRSGGRCMKQAFPGRRLGITHLRRQVRCES